MRSSTWPQKTKARDAARQRPSLFVLAGAGLLLLGMLTGFYLFFPAEALRQRVIQEIETRTGAEVQIGQMALYPLLTLDASQVSFGVPGLPHPMQVEQLSLAPQWSTLLSSDPGVQLQAQLMSGLVNAEVLRTGMINAMATGLRFDLPLQKPLAMNITGKLDKTTVNAATRLDPETKTQLSLQLSDVSIGNLAFFKEDSPGIALGEIVLEVNGQGRAMKINALTAKGGDFNISGEGTLFIGRTSATSRINLSLQIKAADSAHPTLVSLLELSAPPDANGEHHLRVTGTLVTPTINPVK